MRVAIVDKDLRMSPYTSLFCVTQYLIITLMDVVNDLGVLVDLDPHLTFEAHIDNIVQK